MKKNTLLIAIGGLMLTGILVHAFGQTSSPKQSPWLEAQNPTRLEWLVLQKQADEGDNQFGEDGVTVNFYLNSESYRTGEVLCDLVYLPNTQAAMVQTIEDGILKRFEMRRKVDSWARVKIIKKVARL